MSNYIVKTIFTKKECDKILEMDRSFVNRFYHTNTSFKKTWLNGTLRPAEDNILDRFWKTRKVFLGLGKMKTYVRQSKIRETTLRNTVS